MPNIFHQSVEDVLKAATPAQRLAWNNIFLRFGERCAVSQFSYNGSASGELFNYVARKIYLPYKLVVSGVYGALSLFPFCELYNENNVPHFTIYNGIPVWDATAAAMRYCGILKEIELMYFSRLAVNSTPFISFLGYRIMY